MNCCVIETLLWMTILVPFSSALPTQEASKGSAIILHVADQAGGRVPSADVHLVPFPTGLREGLMTDHDGNLLLELPAGDYNVTVKAPAFFPASKFVEIKRDSRQTIQIVLKAKSCPPGPCVPVTSKEERKGAVPFDDVVEDPNWGAVRKAHIKTATGSKAQNRRIK